jgi:transcriptional regulator with XRE-family HTH domain
MPKKLLAPVEVPTLVQERLSGWGALARHARLKQKLRAQDVCARIGISVTTLRRLEHGDPGASAAHYLTALWVLGVMDMVTQAPPSAVMDAIHNRRRARPFDKDDDF